MIFFSFNFWCWLVVFLFYLYFLKCSDFFIPCNYGLIKRSWFRVFQNSEVVQTVLVCWKLFTKFGNIWFLMYLEWIQAKVHSNLIEKHLIKLKGINKGSPVTSVPSGKCTRGTSTSARVAFYSQSPLVTGLNISL